jgi:beta-N-acetylhexosaminidase
MSLEDKIAQMQCVGLSGGYASDGDPELLHAIELVRRGVGMLVLYGGTPLSVAHLTNRLQREAKIPLIFTMDFENGPGQQMAGASEFPSNMAFAAAGSEDLMRRAGEAGAREGRACGIHGTYSPVADTTWNPENPNESVRSLGGDLELLDRMIRANVAGYQKGRKHRMFCVSKHFPGRGDTSPVPGDPNWWYIDKPADVVMEQDIAAFRSPIASGVKGIMTEHIAVPSLTGGEYVPASVSSDLVTGVLRGKLGLRGIVWSDDLWYPHVTGRYGAEGVALLSLMAGHDVLLKVKDPIATIAHLVKAVKSGKLTEARIDESVRKILALKFWLGLDEYKNRFVDVDQVGKYVGTPENAALVQEAGDRSLTMLKNNRVLPFGAKRLSAAKMVSISFQRFVTDQAPFDLAAQLEAAFPGIRNFHLRPDLGGAYYTKVSRAAADADVVFLSLFVPRIRMGDAAPLPKKDVDLIRRVVAAKPRSVVAMSYGNPHLIRKLPEVPAFLVGWGEGGWGGPREPYFRSFIKAVKGELKPTGKLPVEVSKKYPIGFALTF